MVNRTREEARSRGINSTGSESQLTQRLQLFGDETPDPSIPEGDEPSQGGDEGCIAIVSCNIEPDSDEMMVLKNQVREQEHAAENVGAIQLAKS
jgi:hypothetical protein